ncbi:MAG: hypothetical protein NTX45_27230 [Proteobacteria bacterium]|nr:hypothetical protein [Pseudomonadota bacterium]
MAQLIWISLPVIITLPEKSIGGMGLDCAIRRNTRVRYCALAQSGTQ